MTNEGSLEQPHDKVTLVGFSFGGWLAAEIAVTCCHRIDRLVLVDALGIKLGDRETADILDVFNTSPAEVQRRSWHDPVRWAPDRCVWAIAARSARTSSTPSSTPFHA